MMKIIGALYAGILCAASSAGLIPEPVLPQGVGVNIHFVRGHERDLDMIAAAGFKFVRMDFGWEGIERVKGQYDFGAYDELTANLEKRGLKALYILDYTHHLYEERVRTKNPITGQEEENTASPQRPESVGAFAKWAGAAAAHYKGRPIIWEIYNEPNITFWKPKPDVNQYIALAQAVCGEVRKADPAAMIVAPATSGVPLEFLEAFFASGVLAHLNAISVHPYRNYAKSPETAAQDYGKLRELIRKHAPAAKKEMPILSGEWGYASHSKGVSLETQAAFAARQQLANLLAGVPISIWYDWKNDGEDPAEREHHFGTVWHDLKPKPAYTALQVLTGQLAGFRISRRLPTEKETDYMILLEDGKGNAKLAAWTMDETHTVGLPTQGKPESVLTVVDSQGGKSELRTEEGKLRIEVTPAPKYISLIGTRF